MTRMIMFFFAAFILSLNAEAQTRANSEMLQGTLRRGPDSNLYLDPGPPPAPQAAVTSPPFAPPQPPRNIGARSKQRPAVPASSGPAGEPSAAAVVTAPPAIEAPGPPSCAPNAVTCIEIFSTSDKAQLNVPITFGQAFRQGDVPGGARLVARSAKGDTLPSQSDAQASFQNGSLRFAVISTVLPQLLPREKQTISMFKEAAAASNPQMAVVPDDFSIEVRANLYSPQISLVTFGNRSGQESGIPFQDGELITIILGAAGEETFTVAVTGDRVGGGWSSLTKIALAFMEQINSHSKGFRAYKMGEGDGYESLWITTRDPAGKPFNVAFQYGGQAKLAAKVQSTAFAPRALTANVRPALDKAVKEGKGVWLKGEVAQEFIIPVPFIDQTGTAHPQLTAYFNVRLFGDARRVRTDVVIENDWAYEVNPGNLTYDVTIVQQGKKVFANPAFSHFHHSRWHKLVWWGDEPNLRLRRDIPYLLASQAVWNYDTRLHVPEAALNDIASGLARANTGLMGNAMITLYMPTTGGRSDIGPLPKWAAMYLVSGDGRPEAAIYANAEAGASIPIHYRDRTSGQPVSIIDHPGLAMVFGKPHGSDAFPVLSDAITPWTPDSSHQPSLAYMPYLLTGDVFYLDEVLFWAAWNIGAIDPTYRSDGIISWNQVRAQAWALRSLGEAAQISPDHHPAHNYFRTILDRNLAWYTKTYARNPDHQVAPVLGFLAKPDDPKAAAPWQNDFLYLVLGRLVASGETEGADFFSWLSRFVVGRWTHEADGYCHTQSPAYYLTVKDGAGRNIENWGEIFRASFPDLKTCPTEYVKGSFPDSSAGYVAIGRAALAIGKDFRIAGAGEALSRLRSDIPGLEKLLASDPTWAIVPREPSQ